MHTAADTPQRRQAPISDRAATPSCARRGSPKAISRNAARPSMPVSIVRRDLGVEDPVAVVVVAAEAPAEQPVRPTSGRMAS